MGGLSSWDEEAARAAHKRLSLLLHPDKHALAGPEDRRRLADAFRAVTEARRLLLPRLSAQETGEPLPLLGVPKEPEEVEAAPTISVKRRAEVSDLAAAKLVRDLVEEERRRLKSLGSGYSEFVRELMERQERQRGRLAAMQLEADTAVAKAAVEGILFSKGKEVR